MLWAYGPACPQSKGRKEKPFKEMLASLLRKRNMFQRQGAFKCGHNDRSGDSPLLPHRYPWGSEVFDKSLNPASWLYLGEGGKRITSREKRKEGKCIY